MFACRTTSERETMCSACARTSAISASASRPRSARNSSFSLSSQRAWRSSSGRRSSAACRTSNSSSRETSTEADNGIAFAPATTSIARWIRPSVPRSSSALASMSSGASSKRSATTLPVLSCGPIGELRLEVQRHRLGDEGGDVPAEPSDLPQQPRRDEGERGARRDEDRLDPRELTVHLGHLELVLEVRDRAQSSHDRRRADIACDVHDQGRDTDDPHAREVCERLLDHLRALFDREERLALLGVAQGCDDHLVEEARRTLHDLEMTVVERVERPREEGHPHRCPLRAPAAGASDERATVTSVPPYRRDLAAIQPGGSSISVLDSSTATSASSKERRVVQSSNAYGGSQSARSTWGARPSQPGSSARTTDAAGDASPVAVMFVLTAASAAAS